MEDLIEFENVLRGNLVRNLDVDIFRALFPPVNDAYNIANTTLPLATDLAVRQLLLLCHRSFMVAVSLIAAGNPDDSVPVTRRAIETARIAFALVYDRENLARWTAEETRLARWRARREGARPPRLEFRLRLPEGHALLQTLGRWEGALSDAAAHCTPEYLSHYGWERRGESLFLGYIVADVDHLLRTLRSCVTVHLKILELFDETARGALRGSEDWCNAVNRILAAGRAFLPPEEAEPAGAPG